MQTFKSDQINFDIILFYDHWTIGTVYIDTVMYLTYSTHL